MNSADGTIHFNSSFFCKNSFFLRVRLRERFVNPQLLKQLAVYKIKEEFNSSLFEYMWLLVLLLYQLGGFELFLLLFR